MNNYFFDTPVYKIWIDLIAYLSPNTSFLIHEFQFGFVDLKCSREGVIKTYEKEKNKLELVYRQDNHSFFCRLLDKQTDEQIMWTTVAPTLSPTKNVFSDLEGEIDLWLNFLKRELS